MQAVVVKTTLTGEIVWKIDGPPPIDEYKPGPDGAREAATTRPTSPSRPTATSMLATATARTTSISTSSKAEYIRTFGGRGSEPGKLAEPHGIWVDTRDKQPVLVVADRRNNRLQRFTMDGKHIDFVPGFRLPCHFDEHKGLVVIPDLHGRVTLMDSHNALVAQLGDSNSPELEQPAPPRAARQVHPRPVHLPARRLLRSRRQHLRRRVGGGGRVTKLRKSLEARTSGSEEPRERSARRRGHPASEPVGGFRGAKPPGQVKPRTGT